MKGLLDNTSKLFQGVGQKNPGWAKSRILVTICSNSLNLLQKSKILVVRGVRSQKPEKLGNPKSKSGRTPRAVNAQGNADQEIQNLKLPDREIYFCKRSLKLFTRAGQITCSIFLIAQVGKILSRLRQFAIFLANHRQPWGLMRKSSCIEAIKLTFTKLICPWSESKKFQTTFTLNRLVLTCPQTFTSVLPPGKT